MIYLSIFIKAILSKTTLYSESVFLNAHEDPDLMKKTDHGPKFAILDPGAKSNGQMSPARNASTVKPHPFALPHPHPPHGVTLIGALCFLFCSLARI